MAKYTQHIRDYVIKLAIDDNIPYSAISVLTDVPTNTISIWVHRHKQENKIQKQEQEPVTLKRKYEQEIRDYCIRLALDGVPYKTIAHKTGADRHTISLWVREYKERNNLKQKEEQKQPLIQGCTPQEELTLLRRLNTSLTTELDRLKKDFANLKQENGRLLRRVFRLATTN